MFMFLRFRGSDSEETCKGRLTPWKDPADPSERQDMGDTSDLVRSLQRLVRNTFEFVILRKNEVFPGLAMINSPNSV
jgi:hypothetical protein